MKHLFPVPRELGRCVLVFSWCSSVRLLRRSSISVSARAALTSCICVQAWHSCHAFASGGTTSFPPLQVGLFPLPTLVLAAGLGRGPFRACASSSAWVGVYENIILWSSRIEKVFKLWVTEISVFTYMARTVFTFLSSKDPNALYSHRH